MRLVLKQNLAQQIESEIIAARADQLTVERVECTAAEMAELAKCPSGRNRDDPLGERFHVADGEFFVLGVPVVDERSIKRAQRVLEHG
jgi:hypothetical protein